MTEQTYPPIKDRLSQYNNKKYIPRYHESCVNHELRQAVNMELETGEPSYQICLKCLKGHNLLATSPKQCKDYEATNVDYGWKLSLMERLVKDLMQG